MHKGHREWGGELPGDTKTMLCRLIKFIVKNAGLLLTKNVHVSSLTEYYYNTIVLNTPEFIFRKTL